MSQAPGKGARQTISLQVSGRLSLALIGDENDPLFNRLLSQIETSDNFMQMLLEILELFGYATHCDDPNRMVRLMEKFLVSTTDMEELAARSVEVTSSVDDPIPVN